jgi:type II secretory pathway component PulK
MAPVPAAPREARPARLPAGERGIALLIVLVLLLILVPFAWEFAGQVQLEVKTAQNVADQLMLENALDGQFEIVLARLKHDGEADDTDTLNDEMFDDDVKERREEETGVALSTQVADEQGKFNVLMLVKAPVGERRQAMKDRMVRILIEARRDTRHGIDESLAKELAEEAASFLAGTKSRGNIPKPQTPDNRGFLMLEDLVFANTKWRSILTDQRDGDDVAPGLSRFLTIYGTGKVNLNTADRVVLRAYFPSDPSIGDRIVEHREGTATDEPGTAGTGTTGTGTTGTGTTGTGTTGTGSTNAEDEQQQGNPFTDVNQVNTIEGVDPQVLQKDKVDLAADFDVKSHFWSMRILAESMGTRREELYVVERVKQAAQPGAQTTTKVEGFRHHLHEERIDVFEDIDTARR